ncbi:MAG: HXXEE domain-containing protein [Clostridiales bacterium]|nr:HXXEE domain-containing protein [Clostridiales bacterium]
MKFWRRNWYYIGGILFVALTFIMGLWGCYHLPRIQVILIFSWMAMLVHQFEEYALPGGFPSITNLAAFREREEPRKYPFNQMQCFVCNVFLCYAFYILAIIFPNCVWLGASQVLGAYVQLIAHGIIMNIALKGIYNPGLGATVFLQVPVAVAYILEVMNTMPDKAWQIWIGVPGALIGLTIVFIGPVFIFKTRNNNYPFEEEEMYGYAKDKILALYNSKEPSIIQKLGIK